MASRKARLERIEDRHAVDSARCGDRERQAQQRALARLIDAELDSLEGFLEAEDAGRMPAPAEQAAMTRWEALYGEERKVEARAAWERAG